jgi:hypothetical protein
MKYLFVPYTLALLAKEKGFDEPCLAYYYKDIDETIMDLCLFSRSDCRDITGFSYKDVNEFFITAPLYQQLVDWFRDKHSIIIEIPSDHTSDLKYVIEIFKYLSIDESNLPKNSKLETRFKPIILPQEKWGYYRKYYEALNSALTEAFKLI